ncbi:carbamoyl phosphate synthase small subunit [Sulfolobales archaeon HS-7]|nr:carbamoyl phosphate synthase small subunit [Sulfolobales archaeon HS-7]
MNTIPFRGIFMGNDGFLYLEDGSLYKGKLFGSMKKSEGEIVFSTAMNGYPESLTDPSYRGQILVITHPLVGNYGVPSKREDNGILTNFESEHVQVNGLVVSELTEGKKRGYSLTLNEWLIENDIPGIQGIDTRMLVKKIREYGTMMATIFSSDLKPEITERYDEIDFTSYVSPKVPLFYYGNMNRTIVIIDCGVKHGILHQLYKRGFNIVRLPCNVSPSTVSDFNPDAVVISNGPGNPNFLKDKIEDVRELLEYKYQTLGICLGHQLIALALGGKVEKMRYGHRGINKPLYDVNSKKCYISTHNHGYAVTKIPPEAKLWFVDPDDMTIEGVLYDNFPIISVQFHPEARPGPNDTNWIFDYFTMRYLRT